MGRQIGLREQLDRLKSTMQELQLGPQSAHLPFVLDIIANWPGHISEGEVVEIEGLIGKCFQLTPEVVKERMKAGDGVKPINKSFEDVAPTNGWFGAYLEETLPSESPTVFHFVCAAVALGALTDRRFWLSQGHYKLFPNINAMLIAPTGRCRKTAAINIMYDILMEAGYEKFILGMTTPEAFVMDIGANDPASCLIVGREMAAFFRKAKYLEGMVPLFTDLMDCPPQWRSLTIGRGKLVLKNVMLSGIYGTTMDWVNTNLPPDVFGGGFMRRHIITHQERTTRVSPRPADMTAAKKRLSDSLRLITEGFNEFLFEPDAQSWYDDWYVKQHHANTGEGDERMEGYLQSKPDHVIRLAMSLQISSGKRVLTTEALQQSLAILDWLEQYLPKAFSSMAASVVGELEEKILRAIRNSSGRMSHSDLVRRMSKYVTADKLAQMINTLKEGEMVEERPRSAMEPRSYYLTKRARGGG